MSRLAITASPLIERWSVTATARRDRAEWPPSPDTLFSALVAAAASLGNACHPALYWLETLGNPAIDATIDPHRTEGIVHFSPVADRVMWDGRSRQARWHNSIGDPSPVAWLWPIDTTEHVAAIQTIAREVTYIGSSRAPVLATAHVTTNAPGPGALVPDASGSHRIRGLYPGRLDELESAFQQGRRPRPTQPVGYAKAGEQHLQPIWGQMIPLRRKEGPRLHVAQSVPITEAARRALTAHLPDGASGMLTGHERDGTSLEREHIAIVPLPRVGDRHADGEVLGVGLLLPVKCSDTDYDQLISGLQGWLVAGGVVDFGGLRWIMEVAHADPRQALRPNRYAGLGKSWVSVTPVVCDRHPRRGLTLHEVVAGMCRDVGLPAPLAVEATPFGSLQGSADSRRHSLGQRAYLGGRYTTHLRVTWPRQVPGPILLGRGRYFGMGAMLPSREAA